MPWNNPRRLFSADEDATLLAARAAGVTWPEVAKRLNCGRSTVIERARALGLQSSRPPANDMTPLWGHRRLIQRRCAEKVSPQDIAAEIADADPTADVTDDDVLAAVASLGIERPPLPPGHHLTWGAITDGTLLEGEKYPFPVPGDRDR